MNRQVKLGELVDLGSLRDLCRSFSELYGLGLKVFDLQGQKLVDFRAQTGDYCAFMFQHYETKVRCTNLVGHIKSCELELSEPMSVPCFSGLGYRVAPIILEGDTIGRVVYGPFRADTLLKPPGELGQIASDMSVIRAEEILVQIRPIAEKTVDSVVAHCQQVIEAVVFAGYRALVASQMHVESITAAYGDLEEKNRILQESNEKLREMDRLKSNFIATVSHELRTPLTSVIGYSEMLIEGLAGPITDEQRGYIATIMEKGESLLSLITSILDLSKIESGTFTAAKQPTDVAQVIKTALSDVTPQARKKNIEVIADLQKELGYFILDAEKFHRSVTNLLANAVKFTPDGGKITVQARGFEGELPAGSGKTFDPFVPENNHWLWVTVSDTGIGIPADKLQRVFEPFFQVDSSSTREYGGTGLGLAIVKNFIEAHGGTVWAESALGKGSAFHIVIPWASRR